MSAYNAPTESLPIFNSSLFSVPSSTTDSTKANYPVVQGQLTTVGITDVVGITATNITTSNPLSFNYTSLPSLSASQLGYTYNISNVTTLSFPTSGVSTTISSITLPIGKYMFSGYIMASGGNATGYSISFNTTSSIVSGFATGTGIISSSNSSSAYQGGSLTCIFSVSTSATYYFNCSFQGQTIAPSSAAGYCNATIIRSEERL